MYIPGYSQQYFNPTSNRVPNAILGAHFSHALADTPVGQPGVTFPLLLEDDIPSPWLGVRPKVVSIAVQPPQVYTAKEALARKEAERQAKAKGA